MVQIIKLTPIQIHLNGNLISSVSMEITTKTLITSGIVKVPADCVGWWFSRKGSLLAVKMKNTHSCTQVHAHTQRDTHKPLTMQVTNIRFFQLAKTEISMLKHAGNPGSLYPLLYLASNKRQIVSAPFPCQVIQFLPHQQTNMYTSPYCDVSSWPKFPELVPRMGNRINCCGVIQGI